MTLDRHGRMTRANIAQRGGGGGGFGGCVNECYMASGPVSMVEARNDVLNGAYKRKNTKNNNNNNDNNNNNNVSIEEKSMQCCDASSKTRRRSKKDKRSKDRNSVLACLADCFCPLYSIKRDFTDYMYQPAAQRSQNDAKKPMENVQGRSKFAENVDMNSDSAYKGCYYFDNLAVDGQ